MPALSPEGPDGELGTNTNNHNLWLTGGELSQEGGYMSIGKVHLPVLPQAGESWASRLTARDPEARAWPHPTAGGRAFKPRPAVGPSSRHPWPQSSLFIHFPRQPSCLTSGHTMGPVFRSPTPTPGQGHQDGGEAALASPWLGEGRGGGRRRVRQELQQNQLETGVPAPWPRPPSRSPLSPWPWLSQGISPTHPEWTPGAGGEGCDAVVTSLGLRVSFII